MFYRVKLKDHIRLPPEHLGSDVKKGLLIELKQKFDGYISKDLGSVIDVADILNVGDGMIVPGDGAPYFEAEFELITFKPLLQEVIVGKIKDIADFGAFITLGPMDGMIHVSQTMDDFVSFSKEKVLSGRDSNRTLKVDDECRARIIAVSFKDISNPKIGVTMRQNKLGKLEWLEA